MDYINDLYELRDIIAEEVHTAKEKIKDAGGMSGGDYDIVDKITHTMKSLDCCIEKEEEKSDGYSGRMYPDGMGGSYSGRSYRGGSYRGGSYRGGSYARGRGGNARRDSMGRYSNEGGYSRDEGMISELRELMQDAPDEHTRMEFQRLIDKMEQR